LSGQKASELSTFESVTRLKKPRFLEKAHVFSVQRSPYTKIETQKEDPCL